MQLTNVTISDSDEENTVYIHINSADSTNNDADKEVSITRDDLDAGEQAKFDEIVTIMKSKLPA